MNTTKLNDFKALNAEIETKRAEAKAAGKKFGLKDILQVHKEFRANQEVKLRALFHPDKQVHEIAAEEPKE